MLCRLRGGPGIARANTSCPALMSPTVLKPWAFSGMNRGAKSPNARPRSRFPTRGAARPDRASMGRGPPSAHQQHRPRIDRERFGGFGLDAWREMTHIARKRSARCSYNGLGLGGTGSQPVSPFAFQVDAESGSESSPFFIEPSKNSGDNRSTQDHAVAQRRNHHRWNLISYVGRYIGYVGRFGRGDRIASV